VRIDLWHLTLKILSDPSFLAVFKYQYCVARVGASATSQAAPTPFSEIFLEMFWTK
jgi:hypothetical protein